MLLLVVSSLSAQEVFTPFENYCKPGVIRKSPSKGILLEYGLYPGINLNAENAAAGDRNDVNKYGRLRVKLKAPIIHTTATIDLQLLYRVVVNDQLSQELTRARPFQLSHAIKSYVLYSCFDTEAVDGGFKLLDRAKIG